MKKLVLSICVFVLIVLGCMYYEASVEKKQISKKEKTAESAMPDRTTSNRTMPGGISNPR